MRFDFRLGEALGGGRGSPAAAIAPAEGGVYIPAMGTLSSWPTGNRKSNKADQTSFENVSKETIEHRTRSTSGMT